MNETKDKVNEAVATYKDLYPDEYNLFKNTHEEKKNRNTEYGDFSKDGIIERVVYELPERLYNLIDKSLTPEETRVFDSKEFTRWFTTNYPEFNSIENV